MGKDAFYKRKELLRGKLSKNLKKRIIKSMIWSVVLYGSETWTMRKEDIKRLEAFEMWIWPFCPCHFVQYHFVRSRCGYGV